jgi:SagB-type dehydrogenase family enzyme
MRSLIWFFMLLIGITGGAMAGGSELIRLPPPQTQGGMPLMEALKARHSTREFSSRPLPLQVLSDLLWAANGVSRPESGKRTAPSAKDMREISVYLATADGAYLFAPDTHTLQRVVTRDIRSLTGTQEFVGQAPLNLVYVADLGRMDTSEENKRFYSATDTGFIAQNVYLFCASAGLATVVRGSVEREALAAALGLAPHQQITLAQSVGYPR